VDRHNARIITLPLMPPGVPQHGEPYTLPLVVTYLRRPVDEVVAYLQTELLLPGAAFRRLGRVEAVEDLLPRPGGEGEWEENLRLRCSRLPGTKGHRVLEHQTPGQLGKTFVVGSAEQALHRVRALPELHPHGRALRYPPLPWHRSEERAVRRAVEGKAAGVRQGGVVAAGDQFDLVAQEEDGEEADAEAAAGAESAVGQAGQSVADAGRTPAAGAEVEQPVDQGLLVHAGAGVAYLQIPVVVGPGQADLNLAEGEVGLERLAGQHGVLGVLDQLPQGDFRFVPVELPAAECADQGRDVGDFDRRVDGPPALNAEQFGEALR